MICNTFNSLWKIKSFDTNVNNMHFLIQVLCKIPNVLPNLLAQMMLKCQRQEVLNINHNLENPVGFPLITQKG